MQVDAFRERLWQADFRHLITEGLDELREGGLRIRGCLAPHRRLDEREARREREWMGHRFEESWPRPRSHIRIGRVECHQLLRQQSRIRERTRKDAHVIENA